MLPTLIASVPIGVPFLCPPYRGYAKIRIDQRLQTSRSCVAVPCPQPKMVKGLHTVYHAQRQPLKAGICAASLNARCAAEQTQTMKRESSTISVVPFQGKQTPKLDDGGTGSPPKDRGGGGGGGGGGGSQSSGGFFLFGFLLILSILKEKEEEEYYRKRYGVYDR